MTYLIFGVDGTYQGQSTSEHSSDDGRTSVKVDESELASVFESLDIEYLPNIAVTPNLAAKAPLEFAEYLRYDDGVVFDYKNVHPVWPQVDFAEVKFWDDDEYDCPILYSVEDEFIHVLTAGVVSYPEGYTPDWVGEKPYEVFDGVLDDILDHEGYELVVGVSTPQHIQVITGGGVDYMDTDQEVCDIWNRSNLTSGFEAYNLGEIGGGHVYKRRYG